MIHTFAQLVEDSVHLFLFFLRIDRATNGPAPCVGICYLKKLQALEARKKAVQAEADQEDEEQQEQEEEEQQQPLRRLSYDVQNINDQNDDMQVYRIV